jgi:dTDP-glucose pyrophosphorylase
MSTYSSTGSLEPYIGKVVIPYFNSSLISVAIQKFTLQNSTLVIACSEENSEFIRSEVEQINNLNSYEILPIRHKTQGALSTLAWTLGIIPEGAPIVVAPSDALILNGVDSFLNEMTKSESDAGIVVFTSSDPKYSYVRSINGAVVEIAEKEVISEKATAGVFFFKNSKILLQCIEWAFLNKVMTNGQYFVAPSINCLIASKMKVSIFEIEQSDYLRFRTPKELEESFTYLGGNYGVV